jgi:hypothetical protein
LLQLNASKGSLVDRFIHDRGDDMHPRVPESQPCLPPRQVLDAVRRINSEYSEMPGLCLTIPQAARLFGLDTDICEEALMACVEAGFLNQIADRFVKV